VYRGRDGCRAPMQWDDSAHAGFSRAKPWLPVHADYHCRNVAAQAADPDSLLAFTRSLIALRKSTPALARGGYVPLPAPRGALAFLRSLPGQRVLVAINFGGREVALNVESAAGKTGRVMLSSRPGPKGMTSSALDLGPHEIVLAEVTA